MKTCQQCGINKTNDAFRDYYKGDGTYTYCKACERINSREKYLTTKSKIEPGIMQAEATELDNIHSIWEEQRVRGLLPPRTKRLGQRSVADEIALQLAALSNMEVSTPITELNKWLSCELTEEPEYYQDNVYEGLTKKYRKVTHLDAATNLPVYDETYKSLLTAILQRFDAYEDTYYGKSE